MQFTLIFLYLFFYVLSLWIFLSTLLIFMPLTFYSKYSLNFIFSFTKTYTNWNFLIFIIFLLLSGLPPVAFFFVKLNFIIYILNYFHAFFFVYIFIFFFFNMLYYLYVFKYKIYWLNSTKFVVSKILQETKVLKSQTTFKSLKMGSSKILYTFLFVTYIVIFFLLFNFFIFPDVFFIFYNFFLFW